MLHAEVSTETAFAALLETRVEACRNKDIDLLMSLDSPDIVYYDILLPHQFVGTDAVRANFLRWFDRVPGRHRAGDARPGRRGRRRRGVRAHVARRQRHPQGRSGHGGVAAGNGVRAAHR